MSTQILGFVAAACTTLSFLPQALQTLKTKDTSGISLPMYAMFTVGVLLWLIYGVMIADYPLIIANSVGLGLAGCILMLKLKHG